MIIREIRIDSFGSLRNRTITFTDGLNLVECSNGSGRTDLAAFIKFMLYGLSETPGNEGKSSECERFINRETGRAAGVMEIEDEDAAITVERVRIAGERHPRRAHGEYRG